MNRPKPGSDEAVDLGCTCAVLDNHRGRFAPWPPDGWWITEGCPVHHSRDERYSDAEDRGGLTDSERNPGLK